MAIADSVVHPTSVEIRPLDERIRLLCDKAATAEDSEVPGIFSELQAALHEHADLSGGRRRRRRPGRKNIHPLLMLQTERSHEAEKASRKGRKDHQARGFR